MNIVIVHISMPVYYEYEGWIFEYDRRKPFGPWPCRKDLTPRKKAGKKFYAMLERFLSLTDREQEQYRV